MTTQWMSEEEQGTPRELKPTWDYKDDMKFVTVLPDTTRDFAMLTGDLDPTLTWQSPIGVWIHEFKVGSGQFATVVCNKWNEACPFCFENEIYKLQNPDYKARGGRLPKGLSKKALLQVWDFELKQILWLLAGKRIQEGMDFILQKFAAQYKGIVSITRTGKSLNTTYRVDLSSKQLTPNIKKVIKAKMISMEEAREKIILTSDEIKKKAGISPAEFFRMMLPKYPQVDIADWGTVPGGVPDYDNQETWDESDEIADNLFEEGLDDQVVEDSIEDDDIDLSEYDLEEETKPEPVKPSPKSTAKKTAVKKTAAKATTKKKLAKKINPKIQKMLTVKCTKGVYKGKTLQEIVVQTGKTYIQYLARQGSPKEKQICQVLLKEWDKFFDILSQEPF